MTICKIDDISATFFFQKKRKIGLIDIARPEGPISTCLTTNLQANPAVEICSLLLLITYNKFLFSFLFLHRFNLGVSYHGNRKNLFFFNSFNLFCCFSA